MIFATSLAAGTALALMSRYIRYKGWEQEAQVAETAQMEIFTQGIYPVGHPFVNGLHPFHGWEDMKSADFSFARQKLWITLHFRTSELPLKLKLGSLQAATLTKCIVAYDRAWSSPLGLAMARYAEMREGGIAKGKGSVGS